MPFFLSRLALLFVISLLPCLAHAGPVDLNNDNAGDLGVYRGGQHFVRSDQGTSAALDCGLSGDLPVPGSFFAGSLGAVATFNPSNGLWQVCDEGQGLSQFWGQAGDRPVPADFDGDGFTDFVVFRPLTGEWFIAFHPQGERAGEVEIIQFGLPGDTPLVADFDGDGREDFAVFRANIFSGGTDWFIRLARGQILTQAFGLLGDLPVPADFDGDGRAEIAVWRPSSGTWYVLQEGLTLVQQFGLPGDVPSPTDFDGDGRTDFVVFRAGVGFWYVLLADGKFFEIAWGLPGDRVANSSNTSLIDAKVATDFDGDRRSDVAVLRRTPQGTLQFLFLRPDGLPHPSPLVNFGKLGDVVAAGDYDGDGVTDLALVENEAGVNFWRIRRSGRHPGQVAEIRIPFGLEGDIIRPADYDGDGKTDQGVARVTSDGQIVWLINASGQFPLAPVLWGLEGDRTLTADRDGDGRSDFLVARETNGQLLWFIRTASGLNLEPKFFGLVGDFPFAADFNFDGKAEIGIVREFQGQLLVVIEDTPPFFWGLAGDVPLLGQFDGTGAMTFAVWRLIDDQGTFFVRNRFGPPASFPFGVRGDFPYSSRSVVRTAGSTSSTSSGGSDSGGGDGVSDSQGGGGTGVQLSCASRSNAKQQESGFVFKPVSERDGNLVVLFGASRRAQISKVAMVDERPDGDVVLETLDFFGNTNGGRPTFRSNRPGRNFPDNVTLVRQDTANRVHCITVPEPANRYTG